MSKEVEKKILKQQQELLDAFDTLDVAKIEAWENKTTPQIQALKEMIAEAEDILFTPGKSVSELNDAVNQFKKILDEHRIKGKGRPAGVTKYDDRNTEIKLMNNTLLYGAYYDDTNLSQYKHQNDARDKRDLSVLEIYCTIAEYYPDLTPARIKDIVNKETI